MSKKSKKADLGAVFTLLQAVSPRGRLARLTAWVDKQDDQPDDGPLRVLVGDARTVLAGPLHLPLLADIEARIMAHAQRPYIEHSIAFLRGGRKLGTIEQPRVFVREYIKHCSDAEPAEVWAALAAMPHDGVVVRNADDKLLREVEVEGRGKQMSKRVSYAAFAALVRKERALLRS